MKTAEQIALEAREAKVKSDQEALDKKSAEFAERDKNIKAAEIASARKATAEFVDTLVKAGKLLPRDSAGLVAYMAGPNESGVIEFADPADAEKKISTAPDAWLKTFLEGLPKQVEYKEVGAGTLAEPPTDPEAIANQALEYQDAEAKAGRTISVTAAVTHVTQKQ